MPRCDLAALADDCAVRLVPADPPLAAAAWSALEQAMGKLFAQFEREGRVADWSCESGAGGAVVVLAWRSSDTLSGCSHDKLARLLLAHEDGERRLVSAPPIVVELDGVARCVDRAGLRALAAAGRVGPETATYDLRATTLGAWRQGRRTLRESPFSALVAPAV